MIDQHIRELIQGELDNCNSPAQSQELQKLVVADSKVASYYREMKELEKVFSGSVMVEPPKELKNDIMARIAHEKAGIYSEPIPIWTLLRKRLTFEHTGLFAVGLAAGLAFFFIYSGSNEPSLRDGTNLYGTIASPGSTHKFKVTGEGDIKVEGAETHVVMQSADGVNLADLTVTSIGNVDVTVDFDRNSMSFRGFNQTIPASNEFSLSGGTIHFVHSGTGRYTFLFDNKGNNAGKLTVRIAQNGASAVNSFPIE